MDFTSNEDQSAFLSVLEQMAEGAAAEWKTSPDWDRYDWSAEFDALLEENGFLDCGTEPTLGPVAAAAMTHRVARLPVLAECAASAMLRPLVGADLPRPFAVIDTRPGDPVRFLPVARTVVCLSGGDIRRAVIPAGAVAPVPSLFAYPMGVLTPGAVTWETLDADPEAVRDTWRTALAAELGGVLKGGLDAVIAHVTQRQQFGRPLGSFQAVQHRLAGAAANVDAIYWLALKAAQGLGSADAAIALGYAQDVSTRIVYDLHQFMGAMGLTLEHPLHRWTYRARLLRSAMGGAAASFQTVADRRWRAA